MNVLSNRCRVKAGSGGWVDLEDRVTWMVHRSCGVRRERVRNLLHGFAVRSFSYVFVYLAYQVRATPSVGRRGVVITGSQADAPQVVTRARFGKAASTSV